MKQQGSSLIVALALMMFMTALGTIVLQTAHAFKALSIATVLQRPPMILLESINAYALQVRGKEWSQLCEQTAGVQPDEAHTATLDGVTCTVKIGVEKGNVVVRSSCYDTRKTKHVCTTVLSQYYKNKQNVS